MKCMAAMQQEKTQGTLVCWLSRCAITYIYEDDITYICVYVPGRDLNQDSL